MADGSQQLAVRGMAIGMGMAIEMRMGMEMGIAMEMEMGMRMIGMGMRMVSKAQERPSWPAARWRIYNVIYVSYNIIYACTMSYTCR